MAKKNGNGASESLEQKLLKTADKLRQQMHQAAELDQEIKAQLAKIGIEL